MPYSYKLIPESERESEMFEGKCLRRGSGSVGETVHKTPYAILDESNDEIAVVYSETEAEGLVSHLNRGNY